MGHGHITHRTAYALGSECRIIRAAIGQEKKELFATIPVDALAASSHLLEALCHPAQGLVSSKVSIVVVVQLEVVDIEQHHAVRSADSYCSRVCAKQVLFHSATVS
jgi:hypothetical protein